MTFLVTAFVVTLRLRYRNGAELKQKQAAAQKLLTTDNQKIYKFVLTGGPCSGKTTALERLQVFLRERGFRVFVAPEAATMLFINGASVNDFARPESAFAFQQFVINSQMTLEDSLHNYAQSLSEDTVILCEYQHNTSITHLLTHSFTHFLIHNFLLSCGLVLEP